MHNKLWVRTVLYVVLNEWGKQGIDTWGQRVPQSGDSKNKRRCETTF